jgi:hypothetical protein
VFGDGLIYPDGYHGKNKIKINLGKVFTLGNALGHGCFTGKKAHA